MGKFCFHFQSQIFEKYKRLCFSTAQFFVHSNYLVLYTGFFFFKHISLSIPESLLLTLSSRFSFLQLYFWFLVVWQFEL